MGWEEEREREGGENDFPSGPSTNDIYTEGKKSICMGGYMGSVQILGDGRGATSN